LRRLLQRAGANRKPAGWLHKLHVILSSPVAETKGAARWVRLEQEAAASLSEFGVAITQGLVDHFGHGKTFKMSELKSARHQLTELSFFHADTLQSAAKGGQPSFVYAVPGLEANMAWGPFSRAVSASLAAKASAPGTRTARMAEIISTTQKNTKRITGGATGSGEASKADGKADSEADGEADAAPSLLRKANAPVLGGYRRWT
jgi:hypothetical protein